MKRTIFPVFLIATLSLALSACTPESLEGFGDETNNNSTSNSSTPNASTANNSGAQFTADYLAVHAIVTGSCALAGCHGPNSAGGAFVVPAGQNASPAELQAALADKVSVSSGDLLVQPSDSASSDIYTRLLASPPQQMPTTGPLPQGEIDTIQAWIDAGAVYTE